MTVAQAYSYLASARRAFCKPGTERTEALLRAMGSPEREGRFIHVTGTNGKGSFCAMTAAILRAAGYRTGVFSSPAVRHANEVISVNGQPITEEELAALISRLAPISEGMADKPTEFELLTAAALAYFKERACDVVVLEVGMGGAHDATNVIVSPLLSVITGVSLDHTAFLGATVLEIAKEKAGIIKKGCPVLYGGRDAAVRDLLAMEAEEQSAPFFDASSVTPVIKKATLDGTLLDVGEYKDVRLSMLGTYQAENAARVIAAVRLLREGGLLISDQAVYRGLGEARLPARFERISRTPTIIYDGAHNPEGIDAAAESIRYYFKEQRVYFMTGILRDKDAPHAARVLASLGARAFVTAPDNPRALPAAEYAALLQEQGLPAEPYPTPQEAFLAAKDAAARDGVPLVCLGSLYTYAALVL